MTGALAFEPLVPVYRPAAPVFVDGAGSRLLDDLGRRYLDFTSGIGVNALGHRHPVVVRALREATEAGLLHVSNLYRTRPAAELAAWLVARSFADAAFFCNSGAEANEAALKFARRVGRTIHPDRVEVVALRGGFHGRTMGALSLTDRPAYQEPFEPLLPGVRIASLDDGVDSVVDEERTAAVLVEPIQAEGGIHPLEPDTLRALRVACDRAGALLVFDEVQVGLGRTGRLWAHEAAGVLPDIMTLAKPLAGGLPMGAVLVSRRVAAALRPGDHATTFGGGPFVASVALAVCRHLGEPDFLAGVRERGALLGEWLRALGGHPNVAEVRGGGLLWGVQTVGPAAEVVARALEHDLLLCTAGAHVVRVMPPLTTPSGELLEGVDLLEACL